MSRIREGLRLLGQSWRTLRKDPELLVLAGIGVVVSLGIYAVAFVTTLHRSPGTNRLHPNYLALLAALLVASVIGNFTAAAIIGAARIRLKGGDPTLRDGLRTATVNTPKLILWALFQATIGLLLRTVQERLPLFGQIATAIAGVSWALVTMLVVPVLLFEELSLPDSIKRSASLFKERWGEGVTGVASIGGAMLLIMVPLMIIPVALMPISVVAGLAAFAAVFVVVMVATAALGTVFNAALYEYAVTGHAPKGFRQQDFRGLYRPRRRFLGLLGRRRGSDGTPRRPDQG